MADSSEIAHITADLMDKIDQKYPGDGTRIESALVIAEVTHFVDGEECAAIEYFCSDPRAVVKAGLLGIAHSSTLKPWAEE